MSTRRRRVTWHDESFDGRATPTRRCGYAPATRPRRHVTSAIHRRYIGDTSTVHRRYIDATVCCLPDVDRWRGEFSLCRLWFAPESHRSTKSGDHGYVIFCVFCICDRCSRIEGGGLQRNDFSERPGASFYKIAATPTTKRLRDVAWGEFSEDNRQSSSLALRAARLPAGS